MIVAFLVGMAFGVVLLDLVGGSTTFVVAGVLLMLVVVREFDDAVARTEHRRRVRERLAEMERRDHVVRWMAAWRARRG